MKIFTVDAFTTIPFKGNPAGVCILDKELTEKEYQNIAQEINLSETAFVIQKGNSFNLRWFTPVKEVDLCGHATLSAAKILFEKGNYQGDTILFNTKSGVLEVTKNEQLEMNFPLKVLYRYTDSSILLEEFCQQKPINTFYNNHWLIIELEDENALIELNPKFDLLLKHEKTAFCLTAKSSDEKYDFISRFFAPDFGINEDPVTGSAHCYLANYWGLKLEKTNLIGYQASKRGGVIHCELLKNNRVLLKGNCVIMSEMIVEW